ncbi:MAG TPA: Rieske (2Fe-2S) protein [Gemmataceae bacterium]|nr:Rieske (2Fe-2S) protein [Gemmataceae bacterium]
MHPHPASQPPLQRRSFLKWAINGMGALIAAILGIPAIAYLIDPRNRPAAQSDFRTVAKLSELKPNEPKQVVITDQRRDAWTLHPSELIGRVWLIKRDDGRVEAFSSICPHLGCSINFEEKQKLFVCPCHNGTFDLNGAKVELRGMTNPAPRGMDALEVRLVEDPSNQQDKLVQVKYEKFAPG